LGKTPMHELAATRTRSTHENLLVSVVMRINGDPDKFLKSHLSVCSQNFQDFEYIIISADSSVEMENVLKPALTSFDHYIKVDRKMLRQWVRKGALASRGRYILFLEAGDEFAGSGSLVDVLEAAPCDADLLYGHHYRIDEDGTCELRLAADVQGIAETLRSGKRSQGWLREMPCLCAMLVCRDLFLRLKSAANGPALLLKAYANGNHCYHTNTAISIQYTAASSQTNSALPDGDNEEYLRAMLLSDYSPASE